MTSQEILGKHRSIYAFQVHQTLNDLKLAIEGTIVMSQALRDSLDAMYDARIPHRWQKVTMNTFSICFLFYC